MGALVNGAAIYFYAGLRPLDVPFETYVAGNDWGKRVIWSDFHSPCTDRWNALGCLCIRSPALAIEKCNDKALTLSNIGISVNSGAAWASQTGSRGLGQLRRSHSCRVFALAPCRIDGQDPLQGSAPATGDTY